MNAFLMFCAPFLVLIAAIIIAFIIASKDGAVVSEEE